MKPAYFKCPKRQCKSIVNFGRVEDSLANNSTIMRNYRPNLPGLLWVPKLVTFLLIYSPPRNPRV